MKVLIIGLGSIARKHINAIEALNIEAEYFALRSSRKSRSLEPNITDIFDITQVPNDIDFIIISNPTSQHERAIKDCLFLKKPFFIEKPVFDSINFSKKILEKIIDFDIKTYVAFNMRFHPAINFLKDEITRNTPLELNCYCGSYLPNWRKKQDYRKSYSARKELGGGVHLDLIHELDFCRYLLGEPTDSHLYASKKSSLEINSTDIAHYILEYKNLTAFVTLNYYRIDPKREIECVWDNKIWKVDLIKNIIFDENAKIVYFSEFNISDTYVLQMKAFIETLKSGQCMGVDIFDGIKSLSLALHEK